MDDSMEDTNGIAPTSVKPSSPEAFAPPSINHAAIQAGESYSYFSPIPKHIAADSSLELVLGVDEAGRGPVLGPMVYGIYYLDVAQHQELLATQNHFDDSKVLTPAFRAQLMERLCTADSDLHSACGWATRVMSARDIGAGQLKPSGSNNLNVQAMDATVNLIQTCFDMGLNIKEIYVDTVGRPETYQRKLERVFPTAKITVAIKADSLYPVVSAASVCAKVTRDVALEVGYEALVGHAGSSNGGSASVAHPSWGSGYPGDQNTSRWLRSNKDPVFGWGLECRFSWATAKDLLEKNGAKVTWKSHDDEDADNLKLTSFTSFGSAPASRVTELAGWYGTHVPQQVF